MGCYNLIKTVFLGKGPDQLRKKELIISFIILKDFLSLY